MVRDRVTLSDIVRFRNRVRVSDGNVVLDRVRIRATVMFRIRVKVRIWLCLGLGFRLGYGHV